MTDVQVPGPDDVRAYAHHVAADDAALKSALVAEQAAQARVCKVEPYTADLAQALLRRVVRNLAMRNIPLGIQMDDVGGIRIGSTDPEVRRLEAPYRKVYVG